MKNYREILEEYIIPEISTAYITDKANLHRFIQCVIKNNPGWVFDFAEVFDSDYPFQINAYEKTDEYVKISFEFAYLLSLWYEKKQLARVTAYAEGFAICPAQMPVEWENVKWDKLSAPQIREQGKAIKIHLENAEEEYDDISILPYVNE